MATAYICPMCVFNCDNLPDLEQHLEAHEKNGNASPMKLQKPLSNKSLRNSPLYGKVTPSSVLNPQQENSSPTKTYDRRYSCKSCPFSTHSVKTYFNHRQMAHGEQIAVTECPFCDYASQYPGKVKKHLTDEHPLEQTTIESNSTLEKSIDDEKIWNEAPRLTDCPFCSFTSTETEEFRQHILINHLNDKNFRCLICNRLYRYRGDCSFHIRKKHSDRMVGDNVESLREFVGEFHPNLMSATELKELLSASSTSNSTTNTPNANRSQSSTSSTTPSFNPSHSFRCGYCKFSSANSGDVKKHQTWKHANLPSNILPIDQEQQNLAGAGIKRKRLPNAKTSEDEDEPSVRRQRVSMPVERTVTMENNSLKQTEKDLLSPKRSIESDSSSKLNSSSSRVYKCRLCECLAPHRWILERHIKAKHPNDCDQMSTLIVEINKSSTSNSNGEPMTATKSSSSSNVSTVASTGAEPANSSAVKAFSCSACSLQAYHLWIILRHIRNVHSNDGSNAKIIDNINNQIVEDNDDLQSNSSEKIVSPTIDHSAKKSPSPSAKSPDEPSTATMNNEEMLKHLINTALATRKTNSNSFLENLPASLMNNTMAASFATFLGQLTNKQILQQQQQVSTEKAPMVKRYKCSLCPHVSAWGGNVKKHLKRMHPGEQGGHVIDLGLEGAAASPTQSHHSISMKNDADDMIDDQSFNQSSKRMSISDENEYQQTSEIISTKLKDIDNAPSALNTSPSTRPERLYGCTVCTYESTNPSHIHRHVELHSAEDGGGFQCSQCFFLSKWRASIRKHMISSHGSSLASLSNVLEPLIVMKSSDAAVFVKKWIVHENGAKHEEDPNNNNTHSMDASNYYCSSCPYTNSNRFLFEQHHIYHKSASKNDRMNYPCTFCTFHTDDPEALEDHQVLHQVQEDFQHAIAANTLENEIV